MHVLIAGGTGFIGRELCDRLLGLRCAVTVLTRDVIHAQVQLGDRVRCIEALDDRIESVDAVVNLAGANLAERRWTAARKHELVASRVNRTSELIQWMTASATRPRVMVSGSAIGWYGMNRGDTVLTENDLPNNDFAAQLCRRWEEEAQLATAIGVRVCVIRTGIVLGPRGGALAKMLIPFKLGLGGPIASGRQWMSWIAREDIVRLILWLIDRDSAQGAYNATAPNPVRNDDFARELGHALRRPTIVRVPAAILKVALGDMAELLIAGQRVIPQRALIEGFVFEHADLNSALVASL